MMNSIRRSSRILKTVTAMLLLFAMLFSSVGYAAPKKGEEDTGLTAKKIKFTLKKAKNDVTFTLDKNLRLDHNDPIVADKKITVTIDGQGNALSLLTLGAGNFVLKNMVVNDLLLRPRGAAINVTIEDSVTVIGVEQAAFLSWRRSNSDKDVTITNKGTIIARNGFVYNTNQLGAQYAGFLASGRFYSNYATFGGGQHSAKNSTYSGTVTINNYGKILTVDSGITVNGTVQDKKYNPPCSIVLNNEGEFIVAAGPAVQISGGSFTLTGKGVLKAPIGVIFSSHSGKKKPAAVDIQGNMVIDSNGFPETAAMFKLMEMMISRYPINTAWFNRISAEWAQGNAEGLVEFFGTVGTDSQKVSLTDLDAFKAYTENDWKTRLQNMQSTYAKVYGQPIGRAVTITRDEGDFVMPNVNISGTITADKGLVCLIDPVFGESDMAMNFKLGDDNKATTVGVLYNYLPAEAQGAEKSFVSGVMSQLSGAGVPQGAHVIVDMPQQDAAGNIVLRTKFADFDRVAYDANGVSEERLVAPVEAKGASNFIEGYLNGTVPAPESGSVLMLDGTVGWSGVSTNISVFNTKAIDGQNHKLNNLQVTMQKGSELTIHDVKLVGLRLFYHEGGTLNIKDATLKGNDCSYSGKMKLQKAGTLNISDSVIEPEAKKIPNIYAPEISLNNVTIEAGKNTAEDAMILYARDLKLSGAIKLPEGKYLELHQAVRSSQTLLENNTDITNLRYTIGLGSTNGGIQGSGSIANLAMDIGGEGSSLEVSHNITDADVTLNAKKTKLTLGGKIGTMKMNVGGINNTITLSGSMDEATIDFKVNNKAAEIKGNNIIVNGHVGNLTIRISDPTLVVKAETFDDMVAYIKKKYSIKLNFEGADGHITVQINDTAFSN